jgi:hypothetical protein
MAIVVHVESYGAYCHVLAFYASCELPLNDICSCSDLYSLARRRLNDESLFIRQHERTPAYDAWTPLAAVERACAFSQCVAHACSLRTGAETVCLRVAHLRTCVLSSLHPGYSNTGSGSPS